MVATIFAVADLIDSRAFGVGAGAATDEVPQTVYELTVLAGLAVDMFGLDLQATEILGLGRPHGSHLASYAFEALRAHH